ncbi:segregation/condensation protein A [Paradesulfitobacterium aromaticivorans]
MEEGRRLPYVQLPAFQGPLDLLLHLIQQEKVDIWDIPIARIADQFVEAVRDMDYLDMEVTSEFLVLAAQLLYLKSLFLLPKPKPEKEEVEEEDPRRELVERLLAYRSFKQAAEILASYESSSGHTYFREIDVEGILASFPPEEDPLKGVGFGDLIEAFRRVFERAEQGEEIRRIAPEEITIEAMARDVLRRVVLNPHGIRFQTLLRFSSRLEVVMAFLSVLELLKSGKIRAEQPTHRSDITVFPTEEALLDVQVTD